MTDPTTRNPSSDLIERWAWTRQLAGHLVTDPAVADDVAQDAWLRAARHPDVAPSRGFLGTVVRNLVRERARSERHRSDREHGRGPGRPSPAPDEILAAAETGQALAAAVFELPPALRDVLLMRYFEAMSTVQIADALEVPQGTVRSRIKRGLDALRARFDGPGDRSRLAALAGVPAAAAAAVGAAGGAWTITRIAAVAAGAAAVTAALVFVATRDARAEDVEPAVARPSLDDPKTDSMALVQPRTDARRTVDAVPDVVELAGGPALATVVGRCVDEWHRPLEGVKVRARTHVDGAAPYEAVSADDGTFSVALPAHEWATSVLRFDAGELRPRRSRVFHVGGVGMTRPLEVGVRDVGEVIFAPRGVVRGHVVDATGAPVEGVDLTARSRSGRWIGGGTSDEDGRVTLARLRPGTLEIEAFDGFGEVLASTTVDVVPGRAVDAQTMTVVADELLVEIMDHSESEETFEEVDESSLAVVRGTITRRGVGVPGVPVLMRRLAGKDAQRRALEFELDRFGEDLEDAEQLWSSGIVGRALTDADGSFSFECHRRDLAYEVVASAESDHVRLLGVAAVEDINELGALELVPYAELTLRVAAPTGLHGWEFECMPNLVDRLMSVASDANGVLRLPPMISGPHTLFLESIVDRLEDGAGVRVDLLPGESRVVEIDATTFGMCAVTLRGAPASNVDGHVVFVPEGDELPSRVVREEKRVTTYSAVPWKGDDVVAFVRAFGQADVGFVRAAGGPAALPIEPLVLTPGGDVVIEVDPPPPAGASTASR